MVLNYEGEDTLHALWAVTLKEKVNPLLPLRLYPRCASQRKCG